MLKAQLVATPPESSTTPPFRGTTLFPTIHRLLPLQHLLSPHRQILLLSLLLRWQAGPIRSLHRIQPPCQLSPRWHGASQHKYPQVCMTRTHICSITNTTLVSYHSGNFPHGKTVFQPPAGMFLAPDRKVEVSGLRAFPVNAENTNPAAAQETPAKQQAQTLPAEPVFERLPPPRPSSDQQSGETPVAPQTPKSDSGSSVAFDERDW